MSACVALNMVQKSVIPVSAVKATLKCWALKHHSEKLALSLRWCPHCTWESWMRRKESLEVRSWSHAQPTYLVLGCLGKKCHRIVSGYVVYKRSRWFNSHLDHATRHHGTIPKAWDSVQRKHESSQWAGRYITTVPVQKNSENEASRPGGLFNEISQAQLLTQLIHWCHLELCCSLFPWKLIKTQTFANQIRCQWPCKTLPILQILCGWCTKSAWVDNWHSEWWNSWNSWGQT